MTTALQPPPTVQRREMIPGIVGRQYFAKPMHAVFRAAELSAYASVQLDVQRPVLDLGCGKGEFGAAFSQLVGLGAIDIGSDLTPGYVDRARRSGLYGLVLRADATRLPFEDASVGFLVCNGVLCCIEPGATQAISELARVLRPGSQAVITVPTPDFADVLGPSRWLRRVGLVRLAELYASRSNRRHGHRRLEAMERWVSDLESAGLVIEDHMFFFAGASATWWSILAMRPFQALSGLRYAPGFVQRAAAEATRQLVARLPGSLSRTPVHRGYVLLVARKPEL